MEIFQKTPKLFFFAEQLFSQPAFLILLQNNEFVYCQPRKFLQQSCFFVCWDLQENSGVNVSF